MNELIYAYLPAMTRNSEVMGHAGMDAFTRYAFVYDGWYFPIDRSGTLISPISSKNLYPLPLFRTVTKTYEDICDARAKEILATASQKNLTVYVSYSGGIDSTLVLVSLLKWATDTQRDQIVVLITKESIAENYAFYRDYIRGKLRMESADMFPRLIGGKDMFLSGECNDMVLGAGKIGAFVGKYGVERVQGAYDREHISAFFNTWIKDENITRRLIILFERLSENAPIPIKTNFAFLWWITFVLKWQTVVSYTLTFVSPANNSAITSSYCSDRYIAFYDTEDFQLWSMNNPDKRIKDTWESFKYVCKDIIYDFTKDAEYRDHKTKKGSRDHLTNLLPHFNFIDENFNMRNEVAFDSIYVPNNSFI